MIISILGTAGLDYKTKQPIQSFYDVPEDMKFLVKPGMYYNSTDALIKNNSNEKFVFFGNETAINCQKEILNLDNKDIVTIDQNKPEQMFNLFYEVLDDYEEKIIFDITHSFRDIVIMSVIGTIVSRFTQHKKIDLVFAKQADNGYCYTKPDDILDIAELSYLLSSFKHTFNVPSLNITEHDGIYGALELFSYHLMSNQISLLLDESYPTLLSKLIMSKFTHFKPIKKLVNDVIEELSIFMTIKDEDLEYKKFYYFSEIMYQKNYHLISLTYLYEAMPSYIYTILQAKGFYRDTKLDYNLSNEIKKILHKGESIRDSNHIILLKNSIDELTLLYEEIRVLRNNLAHINMEFNDDTANLSSILKKFKTLIIDADVLTHAEFISRTNIDNEVSQFWATLGLTKNKNIIHSLFIKSNDQVPHKLRTSIRNNEQFKRIIELQDKHYIQDLALSNAEINELNTLMSRSYIHLVG